MKTMTLKLVRMPDAGLEAENIRPESFAGKSVDEVTNIELFSGNKTLRLREVFEVEGNTAENAGEQHIILEGDLSRVKRIGESMTCGEITIKGDVGYHLGENMSGGIITVEGNAGSWIGTDMTGGEITIKGNAGSFIGCARRGMSDGMGGGKITVEGDAGSEVGDGMHGGEITVNGNVDSFVGSYMKAGVIKVGSLGSRPGYAMMGGKIIIQKRFEMPFYFRETGKEGDYACHEGDVGFKGKGVIQAKE